MSKKYGVDNSSLSRTIRELGGAKPVHPNRKYVPFVEPFSHLRRDFVHAWNQKGYGNQPRLAKMFNISVPTVHKIGRRLNLIPLNDPKHPANLKRMKRARKLYRQGYGTLAVGEKVGVSAERISQILKGVGVKVRPQHVTYSSFHKTSSTLTPEQLLKEIEERRAKGHSVTKIAADLRIDQGTVSRRIREMGLPLRTRRIPSDRLCDWCRQPMQYVNITAGPRAQKYCSSRCHNMAKDFRRLAKGMRYEPERLRRMNEFLKNTWKEDYHIQVWKLQDVRQINA